jgi:periplasmic divalent cation tolerance protein
VAFPAAFPWSRQGVKLYVMKPIAVFTTIDDLERAQAIATSLVERKLAACVQISEIESVYSWQGATQKDKELRIMAKTVADRYTDVEAAIRALHTYDLPAIYAFGMREVFAPYAEWVAEKSTGE